MEISKIRLCTKTMILKNLNMERLTPIKVLRMFMVLLSLCNPTTAGPKLPTVRMTRIMTALFSLIQEEW